MKIQMAPEALAALEAGDVEALLDFHRSRYGGWSMEADDQDEADLDDDLDDDDAEDDADDEAEFTPPSREEWKKTQDALKKANGQAKKYRLEVKKAREAQSGSANDEKVTQAITDTEAKWKPRLVNKAAKAALLGAGAKKPDRLIKLIDADELEIDEDGEVEGLDDQIEELKADYPELFTEEEDGDKSAAGTRRRRPGSADAGSGHRPVQKKMSSADRIVAGLKGGG